MLMSDGFWFSSTKLPALRLSLNKLGKGDVRNIYSEYFHIKTIDRLDLLRIFVSNMTNASNLANLCPNRELLNKPVL